MTVKYHAILTNQGTARLANAAMLGSKLNLTQMAVGDANGVLPTPDPTQTELINQKRIAPLNMLSVDPNNQSQIIAEQIIPENEGGFWIREVGLYDDEGVLIAVANCPETYKPQLQEGSGRTQTIRMILTVTNSEAITLKIDPSVVLATRQYVDEKTNKLNTEMEGLSESLNRLGEELRGEIGDLTINDATTSQKGIVQLSSDTDSESETLAATPKAVKVIARHVDEKTNKLDTEMKGLSESLNRLGEELRGEIGDLTINDATTSQKGIVQLSSDTNSESETLAATPKAVKTVASRTRSAGITANSNLNDLVVAPMMFYGGSQPLENHPLVSGAMNAMGGLLWNNPRETYPAQIFINYESGMFSRVKSNGGWQPWWQFAGEPVPGMVGTLRMLSRNTATTYGTKVAGSALTPAQSGTWFALGDAAANEKVMYLRIK